MGFQDSTIYAKVALPWIIVGFIFHIIGFPSNSWADTNGGNAGLFRTCGDSQGCSTIDHNTAPSWYRTSLAFEIIGFLFLLAALITFVVYVIVLTNKIIRLIAIVCNSTAIIFIFIGFVVYAGRYGEVWSEILYALGWSFALVVVSHICLFIGLICQFLDLCIPTAESHRLENPHAQP